MHGQCVARGKRLRGLFSDVTGRRRLLHGISSFLFQSPPGDDKILTFPGGLCDAQLASSWSQWLLTAYKNNTFAHTFKMCSENRGIISDLITGWRWGILGVSLRPHLTKLCTVRADWQTMRKSDIRYPRATTDPGPAEGHIATENIKCQVCGNMQRERLRPYMALPYQRLLFFPERNLQKADRPNWQQYHGYFPWQPVESTGLYRMGCGEKAVINFFFWRTKLAIKRF